MRNAARLLAGIALLAGCAPEPTVTTTTSIEGAAPQAAASQAGLGASVNRDLAALRAATAQFHNFDKAVAAGWSAKITSCMELAGTGGMGFHYGNVGLIDGSVQVDQPELLLYEPEKNGRLRLVAVEYIIPYTLHSRDAAPPVLFGQEFKQNDTFQLWGLHAWVWKENPSGMFADWNPRVNCSNTTDVMAM
ncbi:MAG TPA: hypothetical protein VNS52_04345 [Gemmatimonadaceae bacterium]|nr:hypothetical protein [Gemmatimonadaceae bacterium]